MRRAARIRPRSRSSVMSAANRNMLSMTQATASRNWTYRAGAIPFDEIEAIHVGSTTLANDEGAAQTLAMIEDAGGSTTISFDPNCRPNLVGTRPATSIGWMRLPPLPTSCGCRMSILSFSMAAVITGRKPVADRGWNEPGRRHARDQGSAGMAPGSRSGRGRSAGHRCRGYHRGRRQLSGRAVVALRAIGRIRRGALAHLNAAELGRALSFAATCAAITCGRAGADPPRQSDVAAALARLLSDRPA